MSEAIRIAAQSCREGTPLFGLTRAIMAYLWFRSPSKACSRGFQHRRVLRLDAAMEQSIGSLELMLTECIVVQIDKHHHICKTHTKDKSKKRVTSDQK